MTNSDAKKNIIIVDDEPDILKTTKMFLESEGFNVETAMDGIAGLEKIRKLKPDLIVLDLILPKLDGYKICRMLKFDSKQKKTPIVIITARAQEANRKMAEEVGCDAYITKPFVPEDFLKKIKELLK